MKNNLLKFLQWVLPLCLGAYLIYIPYSSFNDQEREVIYQSIKDADYSYIILSVILALASHLSRAWRWNYMLQELGKTPSFLTNVMAIGTGYVINLFIPRGGEIARAGVIRKSDKIPLDKAMGTIIAERVLDLIVLLFITALAFFYAAEELLPFFKKSGAAFIEKWSYTQIILTVISILLISGLLILIAKKIGFLSKIKKFILGLREGFMTIWTMKKKTLYLLHTLFIWSMYLCMFYVCFHSMEALKSVSIAAVLSAFVAGSFSVAFVNGGFGAYPYLIAQILLLFGYAETLGTSIGWTLWLSQTLLVIVYGSISLLLISFNKKLFNK